MSSKNDKEYFIAVKTEYKLLERKYLKYKENLKKWENRIDLARQAGKSDLQIDAESQVEIIRNEIKYLTDKLVNLKIEVEKTVRAIHESPQQLSIDPNKLLADINNLIGDSRSMEIEKDINKINADNELEELKKKMES
ncbi:MAG: hypothetical protein DRP58_03040 [Spirochaetes bacterium]|nr:MAG: hypothetical protein DRP58_03040 [Spirochaetota bacterium]